MLAVHALVIVQPVTDPAYPFEPKSTSYLRSGQFWGVALSDGRWACGRVLAAGEQTLPLLSGQSRRMFLAGLMNWAGDHPPTQDSIAGGDIVAQGLAHVRTIQENGGSVLGKRDLALDGIRGLQRVTHRAGGTVMIFEGAVPLRPATRDEAATMPVLSTWGFKVISRLAERLFVQQLPLASD